MDLPRLEELNEYWASSPPLHLVAKRIAGALGVTFDAPPQPGERAAETNDANLADLLSAIPEVPR